MTGGLLRKDDPIAGGGKLGVLYACLVAVVAILLVGLAALLAGCGILQSPAIAPDVAREESCIQKQAEAGVTDPAAIGITCAVAEAQFVYDFLVALVTGQWGKAHPALTPPLRESFKRFALTHGGHS